MNEESEVLQELAISLAAWLNEADALAAGRHISQDVDRYRPSREQLELIKRNTEAIFVGEPTGSSPNFVGESTPIVLPCSGLRLTCSSLYWQISVATDRRAWIPPDIAAAPSIETYRANRDPAMDAILNYLK